jgi:hypothetical protein
LRTTPFQEGEDDKDIPPVTQVSHKQVYEGPITHSQVSHKQVYEGPITHSRAKLLLQKEVNSVLTNCNFNTSENIILPKCFILMLFRFTHEDVEGTGPKDQDMVLQNGSFRKVTWTDDWT